MINQRHLVYPPVVLAHIVESLGDMFSPKARGKSSIQLHYSAQLNGNPHMGTITSLASAFAIGEYLSDAYDKPSSLLFEALENAPTDQKQIGDKTYCRMHCDSVQDGRPKSEIFMDSFRVLLEYFSRETAVPYEVLYYKPFQEEEFVRRTLLDIIDRQDEFIPFIAPSEKYLRIRFPCPNCRYMEKTSKDSKIVRRSGKHDLTFESICPTDGGFEVRVTPGNKSFIDFNTSIRNVIKEARFIEDAKRDNALNLMVDGGDWVGMAYQVASSLDLLGYRFREMPSRIFTPIIEDWSGAKFSKSIYVKEGTYGDVPEEFVNFTLLQERFGDRGLELSLNEAREWAKEPRKLFRNYSVEYLREVFKV